MLMLSPRLMLMPTMVPMAMDMLLPTLDTTLMLMAMDMLLPLLTTDTTATPPMLPAPTLMELTAMVPTPTTPSARGPLMPMLMPTMALMDTDMLPPATDTTPTPPMLPTPTLMELTAMVPTPTTP